MSSVIIREGEPTGDDCNGHKRVRVSVGGDVVEGVACWYPQMGGYSGKALVVPSLTNSRHDMPPDGACMDVLIWHDGEFPFSGSEGRPVQIHHCCADQFVEFGKLLRRLEAKAIRDWKPETPEDRP